MIVVGFGLACMTVALLSGWAHCQARDKYADALGVSTMLCASYLLSNMLVYAYGMPSAALAYPILDLCLVALVWRAWRRRPRMWKLAIVGLLISQMVLHVAMITVWKTGGLTYAGLYNYVLGVNVLFALELAVNAVPGGIYGLGVLSRSVSRWRGRVPCQDAG